MVSEQPLPQPYVREHTHLDQSEHALCVVLTLLKDELCSKYTHSSVTLSHNVTPHDALHAEHIASSPGFPIQA